MLSRMWRLLETRAVKRGVTIQALASLPGMVVSGVATVGGMIGAALSWASDKSYLEIGIAFLAFALVSSVILLALATAVQRWRAAGPASPDAINSPPNAEDPHAHHQPFALEGLHISSIAVEVRDLKENLFFRLAFRAFNATGYAISIDDVRGFIVVHGTELNSPHMKLTNPSWLRPHNNVHVQNLREFSVVVEQRVPRDTSDALLTYLDGPGVTILLDDLDVVISADNLESATRLPLWGEIRARHGTSDIFVSKIASATGRAAPRPKS